MRRLILAAVFLAMAWRIRQLNKAGEMLLAELLQAKWDATPDVMGIKRFIENKGAI